MIETETLDIMLAGRLNTRIRPYSTDWELVQSLVTLLLHHGVWHVRWHHTFDTHVCRLEGTGWEVQTTGSDLAGVTCQAMLLATGLPQVQHAAQAVIKEHAPKL